MSEIRFIVKARGKHKMRQINIPLKIIAEHGIKTDEVFNVKLERVTPAAATPSVNEQTPATC